MNTKKIWANFAVSDLDRTTRFYTALGFKPNSEHHSKELTSFFMGEDDFVIHFFLKEILQKNLNVDMADSHTVAEIVFTLSAETRDQVDNWSKKIEKQVGKLFPDQKSLEKDIMDFFLLTRTATVLMCFICNRPRLSLVN